MTRLVKAFMIKKHNVKQNDTASESLPNQKAYIKENDTASERLPNQKAYIKENDTASESFKIYFLVLKNIYENLRHVHKSMDVSILCFNMVEKN